MMRLSLLLASLWIGSVLLGTSAGGSTKDEANKKIAELEKKLAALKPGTFDWALHNELRHWYGAVDERKSMLHCDIIFKNSIMDGYMFQCLGGTGPDKQKIVAAMVERATKFADLPHLAAACWIRAGEHEADRDKSRAHFTKAFQVKSVSEAYRNLARMALFARAT